MPHFFQPRQIFRGVGPYHLAALGIIIILLGPIAHGIAGNGVIILLVAELWWAVNYRRRRDDTSSGSQPPGGSA